MRSPRPAILLLALYSVASTSFAADSFLPVVAANDNRTPAGQLANGVLNLNLELRQGRWYPEEEGGVYRDVYAFAEKGQAPQSSGPLIRVAQGTRIHVTVRNTLPTTAKIFGLHSHPGDPQDAVSVAPGETRRTPEPYPVKLQAGTPYRFRLINITDNISNLRVRMVANDAPVQWKVVAKDGAELPPAQLKSSVADMDITVGETYDVECQEDHPANVDLQIWLPTFPVRVTQPLTFVAAK